ncbi:fimbrial protein PrsE [Escherichia coli TA054]|nr:fimbrial protein PrsE [Escherichia coli TA054]
MTGIMLFAVLFPAVSVQAVDNLQFKGNLIIPNCTVNNNNTVQIDWGDVEIQTLNSKNVGFHEKEVSIPLNCPYSLGQPKLKIIADMHTPGGEQGIKTSKYSEGLLVYLKTGRNQPWMNESNKYYPIPAESISGNGTVKQLKFYAYLGRYKEITDLQPGPFTASANMEVRYE